TTTCHGRSELTPVTSAAGMMVNTITVFGETGACKVPVLLAVASPPFARNASFRSCPFWIAVGSLGCTAVDAGPAPIGLNAPVAALAVGAALADIAAASTLPAVLLVRKNTDERATYSAWRWRSMLSADIPGLAAPLPGTCMADAAPQSPGKGGPSCGTLAARAGADFAGSFE